MLPHGPRAFLLLAPLLLPVGTGCAHRRESVYPNGYGPAAEGRGVRVRAPFVDVQVPRSVHRDDRDTREALRPVPGTGRDD